MSESTWAWMDDTIETCNGTIQWLRELKQLLEVIRKDDAPRLDATMAERIAEAVLRDREQAVVKVTAGYAAGSDRLGKHYETRDVTWLPTVAGLKEVILRVADEAGKEARG